MNNIKQLHWPLIIGLGAFGFVLPFMNMTGIMDLLGRPAGPIFTVLLISAAWLAIVLLANVRQPVLTLTCTGFVYGIFAFMLAAVLSPVLTGEWFAPLANPFILPFAVAGILVTNTLWGLAVGLVAWIVQQVGQSGTERET